MAEASPEDRRPSPEDPGAGAQSWRLLAPPFLFVSHFGAVYGWIGLVCAFRWGGPEPRWIAAAGVLALTAGALALLWAWRPRRTRSSEAQQPAYDPQDRGHFMATVTRMVGWLALAGMLAVAVMALLARTCGSSY